MINPFTGEVIVNLKETTQAMLRRFKAGGRAPKDRTKADKIGRKALAHIIKQAPKSVRHRNLGGL